ncbi:MAG TPA: hypothetical protein VNT03_01240 [Baekduia sp.]|nr:hypothetical protein [Baekduia sp.]
MTERDAFGNPIENASTTPAGIGGLRGGDPLPAPRPATEAEASFGAPATATAAPAPQPAPAPAMPMATGAFPSAASYRPSAPVRGRFDWTDRLVGLFLVALFIVPFGVGGWFAYSTWHDTAKPAISAIKSVRDIADGAATTPADDNGDHRTPAAPTPPRGLSGSSLLKPAALDRVLRAVRREPGGKLRLLRLAPDRADLQLTRGNGGLSIVQLRWDGGRTLVRTPAGAGGAKTIMFSEVDRHAPQRLVTAAAQRLHRSTKGIDYVVLLDVLGAPGWSAYFTGGAAFQGDAHGRIVRRIS